MCLLIRFSKILLLLMVMHVHGVSALGLKPFKSDGCSWFPDGNWNDTVLWYHCCYAHDFAYWQGGTKEQKQEADATLAHCLVELDYNTLAIIMQAGVVMGGSSYLPTDFRWGYGWAYPSGYGELTDQQRALIGQLIKTQGLEHGLPRH